MLTLSKSHHPRSGALFTSPARYSRESPSLDKRRPVLSSRLDELLDPTELRAVLEDAVPLEVGTDDGTVCHGKLLGDVRGLHAGVDEDRDSAGCPLDGRNHLRVGRG